MSACSVIFRCDGSAAIGFGHVMRCLTIAHELRDFHAWNVAFAMRSGPMAFELVRRQGHDVLNPVDEDSSFDYELWLNEAIKKRQAKVLVLDARDELDLDTVLSIRKSGVFIVSIDDPGARRRGADLVFYPPVPQVRSLDWDGFEGELFIGWEWVPLRREFAMMKHTEKSVLPRLLVTMGGSDPRGFTLQAVRALMKSPLEFETSIIIGPAFSHRKELTDLLAHSPRRFELLENPPDMSQIMATADLALASFGVTAYELAASGVPAVYLCLSPDHAESASAFVTAGIAFSLGFCEKIPDSAIMEHLDKLLLDEPRRRQMGEAARSLVDGKGTVRLAELIVRKVEGQLC